MLEYDKAIYNSALKKCMHSKIDAFILKNENAIFHYAKINNLDIRDITKQIKLHIPQFDLSSIDNNNFFSQNIVPILDIRFNNYAINFQNYLKKCGFDKISNSEVLKIKDYYIVEERTHKKIIGIEVRIVDIKDAEFIESKFHYLRSFREDGIYHIGLFIEGFDTPICYMNFCQIQREYKKEVKELVQKAFGKIDFESSKMIELSRVWGCGKLPQNTISFLVSHGVKHFSNLNYEFMGTAVNPYLDFSGKSILASNFSPFAVRPVQYQYKANGEYVKLLSSENKKPCLMKMPPNILYVKEMQKNKKTLPIQIIHI